MLFRNPNLNFKKIPNIKIQTFNAFNTDLNKCKISFACMSVLSMTKELYYYKTVYKYISLLLKIIKTDKKNCRAF